MKLSMFESGIFKSPVRATFVGSFLTLTLVSQLWYVSYFSIVEGNNLLRTIKVFYSSNPGLQLGFLLPIFVGITTSFLVKIYSLLNSAHSLKKSIIRLLQITLIPVYLIISLIGSLLIIYITS
jgi:hypothetical protein